MISQLTSWFKAKRFLQVRPKAHGFSQYLQRTFTGLTLIELLVTLTILSVIIFISWSGFAAIFNMSSVAEARSARKLELNQALDFMSAEIRSASRINQSEHKQLGPDSLSDVIQDAGIAFNTLGSYDALALYLEHQIPADDTEPTCPVGTPRSGQAKIFLDSIVYDIRLSSGGWLPPMAIARYGRIPTGEGQFDPCSEPIAGDILIDSISDRINESPNCPSARLSGTKGFQLCTRESGESVDLFIKSAIKGLEVKTLTTTVTSRQTDYRGGHLQHSPWTITLDTSVENQISISWPNHNNAPYLLQRSDGSAVLPLYEGSQTNFLDLTPPPNRTLCYQVFDVYHNESDLTCTSE